MKTIFAAWQSYEREVVPADASRTQREECRRAFYAGARAAVSSVFEAVDGDDDSSEANLQLLDDEINGMVKDLRL